jgi:hypothetical protein
MRYAITFLLALTGFVLMALFGLYDLALMYYEIGKGLSPSIAYPVMCALSMLYGGFVISSIEKMGAEAEAEQVNELEDDLQWADLRASLPPK